MSGNGISWAICKSAPRSKQITMPPPHCSVFLQAGCPSCRPTNSVKALKAKSNLLLHVLLNHCKLLLPSVLWHGWLGVRKSIRPVKNWVMRWQCGVVVSLERGADCLHMVQLMPLHPKTPIISCLIKIQSGFTFLVPAYPGSPGKQAVKRMWCGGGY